MNNYRLSADADRDVIEITRYTALRFGFRQAVKYTDDIYGAAQLAAEFPHLGRVHDTPSGNHYLRYNCGRHALFYTEDDTGILIVRILHQAMDVDQHLA